MLVYCLVLPIPGGGGAQPHRSRGWTELRREPRRALIAQFAVRPALVVFAPIVFNHHPRFRQGPQLLPVQTFVPETTVTALHKTVLQDRSDGGGKTHPA